MREVPDLLTARWYSGEYIGDAKPMARVTVQHPEIKLVRTPENLFSTLPFGGGSVPKELPNVRSVSWTRDIDSDVASCTIEFYNTSPLPLGETPVADELDRPGWYSYNRGTTEYSRRWGHEPNEWSNMLMPDNILRTFEGYGFDSSSIPEKDPNLVQTGMWMIDDVRLTSEGIIVCECRDVGRILIDQTCFPPVNPFKAGFVTNEHPEGAYAYPVSFAGRNSEPIINNVAKSPKRLDLRYRTSSNAPYYGDSAIHGHSPTDAFDEDGTSYWLSVGNARPDQGYSFEWIEGTVKRQRVRRVRFQTMGHGYTAYISLYVDGEGWVGSSTVPYDPDHAASAPNGADIPYAKSTTVTTTGWTEVDLGEGYSKVTRVRVCFGGGQLWQSGIGPYKYRAAVRRFQVFGGSLTRKETITFEDKNYNDYTDIVKLLCAWGGFYWPRAVLHMVGEAPNDGAYMESEALVRERIADIRDNRGLPPDPASDEVWVERIWPPNTAWSIGDARTALDLTALEVHGLNQGAEIILSDGSKQYFKYTRVNPSTGDDRRALTIKVGRVWGDFQVSGTSGPAPIPASVFDKKPLMDGIAYVRDILNYVFFIDEFGSVVFRAPNIYAVGNTIRSLGVSSGERVKKMVILDERMVVQSVDSQLTSRNVRERTYVAGAFHNEDDDDFGQVAHMAAGWNPNPIGLRRIGGWTDQHFETEEECRVMAELIALRQLLTYRTNSVTIPGNPAIQIDDQVRIFERVTSEGYIHYVKGVQSDLSLETGEYTYALDTHWLGERPFKKWAFDPAQLSRETQRFLEGLHD